MRELLEHGNCSDVERVSKVRLESTDSSLAQNYLMVTARHDVFGREQCFFNRSRRTALEKHWLVNSTDLSQKIEILHVAGADLQYVYVANKQRYLRGFHHLRHDQQIVTIGCLSDVFQ